MLPADPGDDEQRAHLTHEHPNGLVSSPSSPPSRTPTFDSRRHPKSPSHQRSHTTTNGSRSSHLLARLVSREEEINVALVVTNERLEAETSRANAAERRALDYFHRLQIATENCERTEQESTGLREELKLYKLQLENAQKEAVRAQDIIDQVVSERNEAEAEAARAKIKARKLQEKLVVLAREEHRIGYQEGLSMGRGTGNGEGGDRGLTGPSDGFLHIPLSLEHTSQNEQHDQDHHHLSSTEVESITNQLNADDGASSPRKPPRSFFPSAFPHPHRPPNSYRPRETTATRSHPSPDDRVFQPARIRSLPEYVRHHLHQPRPGSGSSSSSSSPKIIVESPSEPETTASQPELLSPDAANRPLPQDDAHLHLHHHRPSHAHSQSQSEPPSRSRNEHRDQDRHRSRTQAESIVAQWRADNDASPPRNRPHSFTPSGVPHPHRRIVAPTALGDSNGPRPRRSVPTESAAVRSHPLPAVPASPHPHSRSEVVTPMPFGDVNDHRPPRRVPTESAAMLSHPLPDDSVSLPARTGSPLEHLRQRSRQPRRGSGSSSIPDIIVESPSEPETTISSSESYFRQPRRGSGSSSSSLNIIVESPSEPEMSPSATTVDLLSPEAASRPLPQDDAHEHQHYPSHSYSQSQLQPPSRHHNRPSSSYDAPQHSGTSYTPWPAGFIPSLPGHGTTSSSSSKPGPGTERDHRRARAHPTPARAPNRNATTQNGHVRTRMQSASTSMDRGVVGGTYKAAPPVYPHRRHRDRDRDGDRDRDKDRE